MSLLVVIDWEGDLEGFDGERVVRPADEIWFDIYNDFEVGEIGRMYIDSIGLALEDRGKFDTYHNNVLLKALKRSRGHSELIRRLESKLRDAMKERTKRVVAEVLDRVTLIEGGYLEPCDGKKKITSYLFDSEVIRADLRGIDPVNKIFLVNMMLKYVCKEWRRGDIYVAIPEADILTSSVRWRRRTVLEEVLKKCRKQGIRFILGVCNIRKLRVRTFRNMAIAIMFKMNPNYLWINLNRYFMHWKRRYDLEPRELERAIQDTIENLGPGECILLDLWRPEMRPMQCSFARYY